MIINIFNKYRIQLNSFFVFKLQKENPTLYLKNITLKITPKKGMYLVFGKINKNTCPHLIFSINDKKLELYYFGIAGGKENTKQTLRGRINNVVNKPPVKRAIYWNDQLMLNNLSSFKVFYFAYSKPKLIEDEIYKFLKENNLKYPILNKRRGRPRKINSLKELC